MKIELYGGQFATIDDADCDLVSPYKWYAAKRPHATYACGLRKTASGSERVLMHRLIMQPPAKSVVDHVDYDGLNNSRSNLRVCSNAENVRNQRKQSRRTVSQYKGVTYDKTLRHWKAQIQIAGRKNKNLGLFPDEVSAAMAYDAAAVVHFGKFASTNFDKVTA